MHDIPAEVLAVTGALRQAVRPRQGDQSDVRILDAERGRFVLKTARTPAMQAEMEAEYRVVAALERERPFVPAPLARTPEGFYLYSCLPGEDMVDAIRDADSVTRHLVVAEFGRALRRMHGWQPDLPRPVDFLTWALARAEENLNRGLVEPTLSTTGPFDGADARALLAQLQRWLPSAQSDTAFGHGDYCLPNVMVENGRATGIIDLSRGGYMDRRIDLAAGVWTIRYNLGGAPYIQTFLDSYGYRRPAQTLHQFEALWMLL